MKYMGSKNRIAKYILPIMLAKRRPDQWWVEPFVGGGNIIDKVEGKRLGADVNPYVIKALEFIRDNPQEIPRNNSEYTEEMFNKAKLTDLSNPVDCFAMFQYSHFSVFKKSWAKNKRNTDYVKEGLKNVLTQSLTMQGVILKCSSYEKLSIPDRSIIYCDPPYKSMSGYKNTNWFDHVSFWQWCRDKVKEGHTVFVSECSAPSDFKCIWTKQIINTTNSPSKKAHSKVRIEKLFRYKY